MEDYEKRGSGSSAEDAVIGRPIVAWYLVMTVGAVALMSGVDIMGRGSFLDVTVGVGLSIYEINSSGFVS